MKSSTTAYLLWLLCFLGFCGIHRFYADKPISGVIWLFTGGLCFIGQFIGVIFIEKTTVEFVGVIAQV